MSLFPRIVANEFAPMFRLMDDYASHVATRGWPAALHHPPSHYQRTFQPRFDIKESKEGYELQGEVPGVDQKNLTIEFSDPQTISIRGKIERVREQGTRPSTAATESIQSQPAQDVTEKAPATSDTAASESSSSYHKASVEEEGPDGVLVSNPDAPTPLADTTEIASSAAATPATTSADTASVQPQQHQVRAQGPKYWLSERSVGSFSRTFQFDHRVDVDAVKASLKNGILSIVVPKAPAPVSRTIHVE